ncbi:MAG: hypothetical protein AABX16_00760 [Nanoarchaeota archaeon]
MNKSEKKCIELFKQALETASNSKLEVVRKKAVERLFNSFKKEDLLEDRAEYDKEDLQSAYPELNSQEVKLLYLKIQQWKYSKSRKNKKVG